MSPLRRLLAHRLRPVDLRALDALAAVLAAMVCAYAAMEAPLGVAGEPAWLSVATGAVIGLPLAARRRWPVSVAAFVTAASTAALLTRVVPDYAAAAPALAVAFAFYAVGLLGPERRSVATAAAGMAAMTGALAVVADGLWSKTGAVGFAAVMIVPVWVAGLLLRERRAHAARYRAQLVREAAGEERLLLARELHDIVGHTMSLIAVKAAVAVHVAEERPQEALDALRVIEKTSREALTETRQLLGMLRDDTPPSMEDVRALADRASVGGVEVTLDVQRDVFDAAVVPDTVARSAYRILQEALTNVVKHAAPAACRATVAMEDAGVRIRVVDDGRRPFRGGEPGHGLIGIRERVGMHGGTFAAGRRPEGGFTLDVRLPVT